MGLCCKLAGMKYDLEHRYPIIMKLERRMCTVEYELNKNNPCIDKKHGKERGHHREDNCRDNRCHEKRHGHEDKCYNHHKVDDCHYDGC